MVLPQSLRTKRLNVDTNFDISEFVGDGVPYDDA